MHCPTPSPSFSSYGSFVHLFTCSLWVLFFNQWPAALGKGPLGEAHANLCCSLPLGKGLLLKDGGKSSSPRFHPRISSQEARLAEHTCTLADLTEGQVGKLLIRKSGKVQLLLGKVTLDVTMGTACSFLQVRACRVRAEALSKIKEY